MPLKYSIILWFVTIGMSCTSCRSRSCQERYSTLIYRCSVHIPCYTTDTNADAIVCTTWVLNHFTYAHPYLLSPYPYPLFSILTFTIDITVCTRDGYTTVSPCSLPHKTNKICRPLDCLIRPYVHCVPTI